MQQIAIVARLRPGMEPRAHNLIADGPPFDPAEAGLNRHAVYLAADEVVWVFEGPEVEQIVEDMIDLPFHWRLADAFAAWRPLLAGQPRIARPVYTWTREPESPKIACT